MLYDADFVAWANAQAALPRAGRLSDVDVGHIAGEIEALGRGERRELEMNLAGDMLPRRCPHRFEQAVDGDFWPAAA